MLWSDPPTLRVLDPQGDLWRHPSSSFRGAAARVLGNSPEAIEEAVTLSLTALTAALAVLGELLPGESAGPFSDAVRKLRADRELRGRFKAAYATRTASGLTDEYPGAPTMLTDPFCLETNPAAFWFDADTCERIVCAFIARQTLNRRRALLDIHETGTVYSLRGRYGHIKFLSLDEADVDGQHCRYYVHPRYDYRRSARKLCGAEVVLECAPTITFDVDLETGDLIDCFGDLRLSPGEGRTGKPPYLLSSAVRAEKVSDEALQNIAAPESTPSSAVLDEYTFTLIKRVVVDTTHQIALNRAITQFFRDSNRLPASTGWALHYSRWIQSIVDGQPVQNLVRPPEEKLTASIFKTEGAGLNALLALWLQAQIYLPHLPTDPQTYVTANIPATVRRLESGANRGVKPDRLLVNAWCAVWRLLELYLQHHSDASHRRITYQEFVDAMPIRVYPSNFESEFENLRQRASWLAEAP